MHSYRVLLFWDSMCWYALIQQEFRCSLLDHNVTYILSPSNLSNKYYRLDDFIYICSTTSPDSAAEPLNLYVPPIMPWDPQLSFNLFELHMENYGLTMGRSKNRKLSNTLRSESFGDHLMPWEPWFKKFSPLPPFWLIKSVGIRQRQPDKAPMTIYYAAAYTPPHWSQDGLPGYLVFVDFWVSKT